MTDNTPEEFPQTPTPKSEFNYLPSPPITPICERSIKRENTGTSFSFSFDDIGESTASSDDPTTKVVRGRKPRGRPPKSTVGHPRSTGKKLSVRRKLATTGKIPKRIGVPKPTIPPLVA